MMSFPDLIPCWNKSCDRDARYQKTVISPRGNERLVFECQDCRYKVEIPRAEIAEYADDFATNELKLVLANALSAIAETDADRLTPY